MASVRDRRIRTLSVFGVLLILTPGGALTSGRDLAPGDANERAERVTKQAVSRFMTWAARRNVGEWGIVEEEVKKVFPTGATIENYPEVFDTLLPRQLPPPLSLVNWQLARKGIDTDSIEALSLFKGDNGLIQVDVVLVLTKGHGTVLGVFRGFYGR